MPHIYSIYVYICHIYNTCRPHIGQIQVHICAYTEHMVWVYIGIHEIGITFDPKYVLTCDNSMLCGNQSLLIKFLLPLPEFIN